MPDLSPDKLFLLFIVVVVLLGPNRLPEVARQLGAGWRRLREFRDRMDQEVRKNMPDLPSTQEITRLARSPAAFLDRLASAPADLDAPVVDPAAPPPGRDARNAALGPFDARSTSSGGNGPGAPGERGRAAPLPLQPLDDPSMN